MINSERHRSGKHHRVRERGEMFAELSLAVMRVFLRIFGGNPTRNRVSEGPMRSCPSLTFFGIRKDNCVEVSFGKMGKPATDWLAFQCRNVNIH